MPAVPTPAQVAAAAGGDRRHAAVLVTDISGYTQLCAAFDPEQIRDLLRSFFELADATVHQFGGHVIDHAGDALVACFGAPVAQGDDATRAIQAVAMLHARTAQVLLPDAAQLQLHSGVALGEVVTGVVAVGAATKFTVIGHALNVAARLSAAAPAGVVLVCEPCRLATEHAFEYTPHDDAALDSAAQRIKCWQLQSRRAESISSTQMVGRDREVALLNELLANVEDRSGANAVTIVGPAGVGKSRLLTETARTATARGWRIQWLRFEHTQADNPLARLVQQLLRDLSLEHDLDASVVRQLQAIFGIGDTNCAPALEDMEWTVRCEIAVGGVLRLLKAAAAQAPMLLLVEDVHFAAAHAVQLLRAIYQRLSSEPILLLATTRQQRGTPLLETPPVGGQLHVLSLAELSTAQCWQVASVSDDIPAERIQSCIARAGGNPLYLGELLKLARSGATLTLPTSLQTAIQARVDRLAPGDRELLQCAAVLGPEFTLADLSALAARPADTERLVAADFLQEVAGSLRFAHSLINEAVYASILHRRRRELHAGAAALFRSRNLPLAAHHLAQADSPEAAAAYLAACEAVLQAGDAQEAIRLAECGRNSPGAHTHVQVLLDLACAQARRDVGDVDACIDILTRTLQTPVQQEIRARLFVELAESHRLKGRIALALNALASAEACAPDAELLGRLKNLRGNLHFAAGSMRQCRQSHEEALALAREAGDRRVVVSALSGLGDAAYSAAQYATGAQHFGAAAQLARSEGLARHEITSLAMQALCLFYVGCVRESKELSERALEQARRSGVLQVELVSCSMWGIVHALTGGHAQVLTRLPPMIHKAAAAQARRFEVVLLRILSDAQYAAGHKAPAYESCLRALALSAEHNVVFARLATLGSLARLAPDAQASAQWLREGFGLLGQASTTQKLLFCAHAIDAAVRMRDNDCTNKIVAVIQAACEEHPCAWSQLHAERGHALLAYLAGRDSARADLVAVRAKLQQYGFVYALELIDEVLAEWGAPFSGFLPSPVPLPGDRRPRTAGPQQ